jgi:uracil-DNA glycosylase family 4
LQERSPSGKLVVPSSGPLNAKMVWMAESPAYNEMQKGEPLVGRSGEVARAAAKSVGIEPTEVRMINLVPVRAPGDKFAAHDERDLAWGIERAKQEIASMPNAQTIVLMGNNPLHYIGGFGSQHTISEWRGSAMRVSELRNRNSRMQEDYLPLVGATPASVLRDEQWLIPTFHPSAVARQYRWHPWLMMDLKRAKQLENNDLFVQNRPLRQWYFNDLGALQRLAERLKNPHSHSGILAFDTESWPYYIVGLATEDEVHVFGWNEKYRDTIQEIFNSPWVIKVAHNIQHDLTFLKKKLAIDVALPWFDTMGGAHVLNNALEKSLSPHISTRYTNWPYHKFMVDHDPLWYNGLDCVVAYDAYEPQIKELLDRNLYQVAKHDHELLQPLLDMQWYGFKINAEEQQKAADELGQDRSRLAKEVQQLVTPIVDAKLQKFQKPKLFEIKVRCDHCGGGKIAAAHCWRCAGLSEKPNGKSGYDLVQLSEGTKRTIAALRAALPVCAVCQGTGKVTKRLEFNPDSPDQVADVLYRGLGIRPRKYKGVETVRVGLLEPLASEYPLVEKLVEYARVTAEHETVTRLSAGPDGRLHCVFDPFGTGSGRVASKEGLVEVGTNAMNIPKKARRLVVPENSDYIFLYPDMKAVEGRAIAVLSKDRQLIEAFNDENTDMHMLVRDDMRKLGFTEFSRDQAKRLEYATFYGGKAKQVSVELSNEALQKQEGMVLTETQTQVITDALLAGRFQGIARWHTDVERELLATRRVTSPTGRQGWWLDYIYDTKTKGVKNEILKQAWSFAPQDIGGWVLGEGMLAAWKSGQWARYRGLIHVHDALLFMALRKDKNEAIDVLTKLLSREMWGMKFLTEMKVGDNWYEAS